MSEKRHRSTLERLVDEEAQKVGGKRTSDTKYASALERLDMPWEAQKVGGKRTSDTKYRSELERLDMPWEAQKVGGKRTSDTKYRSELERLTARSALESLDVPTESRKMARKTIPQVRDSPERKAPVPVSVPLPVPLPFPAPAPAPAFAAVKPKYILPSSIYITPEDEIFMTLLRELGKIQSIIVVVYMHGIINPDLPLITAPEGMCVTLTRTAATGCVAVEFADRPVFKDIPATDVSDMLSSPKKRADALARRSKAVLEDQQESIRKLMPERIEDISPSNEIGRLYKTMLKTKGRHCDAVTCSPNQLFYDKWYHRDAGSTLDTIEVINAEVIRGMDIMDLMIKHGFGTREEPRRRRRDRGDGDGDGDEKVYESITRDELFKFFHEVIGVCSLTLFDTTCSTVQHRKVRPDFDVDAYIEETEARGALGGTGTGKTYYL